MTDGTEHPSPDEWAAGGRSCAIHDLVRRSRAADLGDYDRPMPSLPTILLVLSLPVGAVWDYYCVQQGVPAGLGFLDEIRFHERAVLAQRA